MSRATMKTAPFTICLIRKTGPFHSKWSGKPSLIFIWFCNVMNILNICATQAMGLVDQIKINFSLINIRFVLGYCGYCNDL